MEKIKGTSKSFKSGLEKLGFEGDNTLFFTDKTKNLPEPEIAFHIETAKFIHKEITAIFLRKQLNGSYKPQVYLFDFTDKAFSEQIENEIADIQRKIWSSGEVPLACFFFTTEIKIIDCTKHLTKDFKPEYLTDKLRLVDEAHRLYNDQFAVKIKSGIFWEQEEIKGKFEFKNSAYDTLIRNIRNVTIELSKKLENTPIKLINKIIVQSILIKYLEETSDNEGRKLLTEKYFKKYNNSNSFSEVLRNGKFINLLNDLNKNFNGNVFKWETLEQEQLGSLDLSVLAKLLSTDKKDLSSSQEELFGDWRYFEFKYIPVELISRLYEEFLGENKKDKGLFYTPSHLAKLLVDECLPLKKYKEIDLANFRILDPACGSGIFLVTAFKRLVQIWRLQHNLDKPNIDDLKKILRNIYGVDKEEQAVMLSSFSLSLALCNELKPIEVINRLKFDDLTKENLMHLDFFECKPLENKKFDLIIGNPPFVRGGTKSFAENFTKINNEKVKIPVNQIALKFLGDCYLKLKDNGLQCLLVKSSSLLYNSSSIEFRKKLFSATNIVQIFDFTLLAEKALWDGARVGAVAVFMRNQKPDFKKNLLHLTFKWTKNTKDRIFFEIDDYDLHYINRNEAVNSKNIWKINLIGGGRIKNTINKLDELKKLSELIINTKYGEGIAGAKSLPNDAFNNGEVDLSYITKDYINSFQNFKTKDVLNHPNFIIKENIDLPFAINKNMVKFSNEFLCIHSEDIGLLNSLKLYFEKNHDILRFFNIATSGKMLISKDTACKQEDLLNLPVDLNKYPIEFLSIFDKNIIKDVTKSIQFYLRHRGNSKLIKPINNFQDLKKIINNYGSEFSRALNSVYENKGKRFRLSDVVQLDGTSLIATVFRYDNKVKEPLFHKDFTKLNIDGLTNNEISAHLSVKRIIKLYPQKDTIVFIKPNQYRYWLSLIAYRDADKCFSDLSNQIEG